MIRLDQTSQDSSDQAEAHVQLEPIPGNGICQRLGDRWTVQVLCSLAAAEGRRRRFSALKSEVGGITQRMLTLTLRNLERDGLVLRHYFPEVPPRVEYALTDMGLGVLRALESVNLWVRANLPRVEECRRSYDDGRAGDQPTLGLRSEPSPPS